MTPNGKEINSRTKENPGGRSEIIFWNVRGCSRTVGTTLKRPCGRPCGNPAQHSPRGHVAHQLYSDFLREGGGGAYDTLKPMVRTTPFLVRTCCLILIYTARSTFDKTMLSHLRQLVIACIPLPAQQKDKNDGKPPPSPWYLTAAYRTMMALPLPQHHHDKPKSPSTIKGDRVSDTIKGLSRKERKYAFLLRKNGRLIIREKTNKTIKGCVRIICPNVFCRLVETGIIFG